MKDYTVSYDQGTGTFVVLQSNVLSLGYTAVSLTSGVTY